MSNTRLVKITTLSTKEMYLSLYYGNKFAEKARIIGSDELTGIEIRDTIEQFRMYGLGD